MDDAILETGNRTAKQCKRNIFWSATSELGEDGKKVKYAAGYSTGKRAAAAAATAQRQQRQQRQR